MKFILLLILRVYNYFIFNFNYIIIKVLNFCFSRIINTTKLSENVNVYNLLCTIFRSRSEKIKLKLVLSKIKEIKRITFPF